MNILVRVSSKENKLDEIFLDADSYNIKYKFTFYTLKLEDENNIETNFYFIYENMLKIKMQLQYKNDFGFSIMDFDVSDNKAKVTQIIERQIEIDFELIKLREILSKEFDCYIKKYISYIELDFKKKLSDEDQEKIIVKLNRILSQFNDYEFVFIDNMILCLYNNYKYIEYFTF